MTAVLIPTATEDEWLAARRLGITASEIAIIMGLAPAEWPSPFSLYHQKTGALPAAGDSISMRVGRHFESLVCELFAEQHAEFGLTGDGRMLYSHPDRPWQMATPDRVVCDIRFDFDDQELVAEEYEPYAVLEAKTSATYEGWGEEGSDEIPVHYRCQALWQMDVMGLSTAYVPCLFLPARTLRTYEVTLDGDAKDDLQLMRDEAALFLKGVASRTPPDIDWRPSTTSALKTLHPGIEDIDVPVRAQLARSYRSAVRRYDEAKKRKAEMTNRMLQAIGTGRRALDPACQLIATRSVYPNRRIDVTALRSGYPAAATACTVTKDVTKLLPAKGDKS